MKNKKTIQTKIKTQGFRIAIYVRVSTEEQAENPEGSIKNQEMRLREYVKLKNMIEPFGEVAVVFSDPGVSAKNMNRPGFQRMLKAIEQHEVDLVLVTELSRFSRSTKDFANLQDFLETHNCKFMSIRENFDTSGAAGAMVLNLMASIAEFERRQTAERISHSFLARAKRGLYNGGSVPLGYMVDADKRGSLKIVPEEAELVKLFFQTFLREQTLAATAKWLNSNKIAVPRRVHGGGSIRAKTVRFDTVYRVLKNKAYVATRVFQTKNGWEQAAALWEPIIDHTTFTRVQKMLEHNCNRRKTHKNKLPYGLTGLIFCKECGESMSGASATGGTGKRVGYYEHAATRKQEASLDYKLLKHKPRRIPLLKIEPAVWTEVKRFIQDEHFAKDLLTRAQTMQGLNETESKQKNFESKRGILDRQIALLAERIGQLPETIDPKPLFDQLAELQVAQAKINNELSQINKLNYPESRTVSFDSLDIFRSALVDLISKGENDLKVRSAIIKLIVHKIEILQDGFEIHFHVGEAHYNTALEDKSSNASFFVSFARADGFKNKKPSEGQPSEGFKFEYRDEQISKSKLSELIYRDSSRRLTNGGSGRNRTGTGLPPQDFESSKSTNFITEPLVFCSSI